MYTARIYTSYLIFLAALFYASGATILRAVRWRENDVSARHLLALTLGMVFWMYLIFALSAAEHLTRSLVVGFILAAFVGLAATQRREFAPPDAGPTTPRAAAPRRFRGLRIALGLMAAVFLLLHFLLAMLPEPAWDAQTYHLLVPKLTVAHHGFRPIAFNVYSHWPMNTEQLYALAMIVKDYRLAAPVHFLIGLLTLWLIWIICRDEGRPEMALFGILWLLQNPAASKEFGEACVDVACGFFLLAAFWQIRRALAEPAARRRRLLMAGVFAGALAGSKFSGFFGAACLAPTYLIARRGQGRIGRDVAETFLYFVLPAMLLWAPWAAKSAWETGNPVYPELFGWFGGIEWNGELGRQFNQWHQSLGMGRRWFDYMLLPARVFALSGGSEEHFGGMVGRHWLLLIPGALAASRRSAVWTALTTAGLFFLFWGLTSQQTHLLVPALPLLSVACATALGDFFAGSGAGRRWIEGALLAVSAIWLAATIVLMSLTFGLLTGDYSPRVAADPTPEMFRFVNEQLPADARLLLLNTNQGFFCEREFIANSAFEASQINTLLLDGDGRTVGARLAALGVTHVAVWRTGLFGGEPPPLLDDARQFRLIRQTAEAALYQRL